MLHKFKMVQHMGSPYIDLYLDDVKLEGVIGVKFEVDTNSIPAVFLDMLVKDIDIEIEEAKIITTKKEVKTDVAQPEEKPAEESGTVPCNGGR